MVKKGGLKRKIPIEKKTSRAPCYTKRCNGLFSKAAQLCLLSGAQIGVLATPMSDNSNVSFFSFAHASVDAILSAFLSGKPPPRFPSSEHNNRTRQDIAVCSTQKALGLGFWWEDETLTTSQNPQELSHAIDSMSKLLKDAKQLRSVKKKTDHHHGTQEPDQTLITRCFSDDLLQNTGTQIMPNSQEDFSITDNNNALSAENLDTQIMPYSQEDFSITDNNNSYASPAENWDDIDIMDLIDFETTPTQIMANSQDFSIMDNNNNIALPPENFDDYLDIMNLDHETTSESLFPDDELLNTTFESLLSDGVFESTLDLQDFASSLLTTSDSHDPTMFSHSQLVQDGDLLLQNRGLNDDYLHFSDVFNVSIVPL